MYVCSGVRDKHCIDIKCGTFHTQILKYGRNGVPSDRVEQNTGILSTNIRSSIVKIYSLLGSPLGQACGNATPADRVSVFFFSVGADSIEKIALSPNALIVAFSLWFSSWPPATFYLGSSRRSVPRASRQDSSGPGPRSLPCGTVRDRVKRAKMTLPPVHL
jgi:hypothetical protein